jgi:preprotein translocase subunit SecB
MQASPLQIDAYFLKDLSFSINDELELENLDEKDLGGLALDIKDKTDPIKKEPNKWRSEVLVEVKNEKGKTAPYTFKIIMVGFFTLDGNYPNDRAKLLVETNAPAILYSAIREIVFNMTSRNPFPTLLLPSVTFLKPEKSVKETKARKTAKKKT